MGQWPHTLDASPRVHLLGVLFALFGSSPSVTVLVSVCATHSCLRLGFGSSLLFFLFFLLCQPQRLPIAIREWCNCTQELFRQP